jgi:hypothetical protein
LLFLSSPSTKKIIHTHAGVTTPCLRKKKKKENAIHTALDARICHTVAKAVNIITLYRREIYYLLFYFSVIGFLSDSERANKRRKKDEGKAKQATVAAATRCLHTLTSFLSVSPYTLRCASSPTPFCLYFYFVIPGLLFASSSLSLSIRLTK